MARRPRNAIMTSFFHVMTQGIEKSYIFEEEKEIKYYINIMEKKKSKYDVDIIAYCIMNNHAHLLLKVKDINSLSSFMHSINTQYAIYYNQKHDRVGYVFRNRYKSQEIYTDRQLWNCISYIFYNPVKAGICKSPEEYPYSNYRENRYKLAKPEKETEFIDIEEKISLSDCIKEYLGNRNIEYVKNDKNELKNMVNYLKNVKSFSFRKMEKELGIGREKLRMLLK